MSNPASIPATEWREFAAEFAELIFVARHLAAHRIELTVFPWPPPETGSPFHLYSCAECLMSGSDASFAHTLSCRAGRVLACVARLQELPLEKISDEKETAREEDSVPREAGTPMRGSVADQLNRFVAGGR